MLFQDICRGVTERESGICQNTSSYVLVYDTGIAVNNLLPYSVGCVTVRPMSSPWSLKQHWPKP